MYEAFDSYLGTDTWHTDHDNDRQRFMIALAQVIDNADFNPDEMRRYMRDKKGLRDDVQHDGFSNRIDQLAQDAWAIKDFRRMTAR